MDSTIELELVHVLIVNGNNIREVINSGSARVDYDNSFSEVYLKKFFWSEKCSSQSRYGRYSSYAPAVVAHMCVYTARKFFLHKIFHYKKVLE